MEKSKERDQLLRDELRAKIRPADRARARAAFNGVLNSAGISVKDAFASQLKLESSSQPGFKDEYLLTDQEGKAAAAWDDAIAAARIELCSKPPYLSEEAFAAVDFLDRDWPSKGSFVLTLKEL